MQIVWRFKLNAVNSLVLFAIIGQDEIFQCNLYNRKEKENDSQGEETIIEQRFKNERELVNYSNTWDKQKR